MKRQYTILRIASLLAPVDQRAGWLEEWRSELWYVPRNGATLFCLGAFQDALWLRRNNLNPRKRTRIHLESPANCLAFLATLAAVSILIAVCLSHLRASDLPMGIGVALIDSCLLLPVTRLVLGWAPADRRPTPWPGKLRRAVFLALKIALVQPIMFCGFLVLCLAGELPVMPLIICAYWLLALRWVLVDQRRRCPVCLRLLTHPVRIGDPSHTFLEWYGAESMCSHGHGFLQVPEISASYAGNQRWLKLDGSWRELFSEVAGTRQ